jgi:hypothetical protein
LPAAAASFVPYKPTEPSAQLKAVEDNARTEALVKITSVMHAFEPANMASR